MDKLVQEQESTQTCLVPCTAAGAARRQHSHSWWKAPLHLSAMQPQRRASPWRPPLTFSFHEFGVVFLSLLLQSARTCTSNLSSRTTLGGVSGRTLSLEFVSPVWFTESELVWSPRAGISSSSLGLHERGVRKKSSHMLHRNLHILKGILYPRWNIFNGPQIRGKKKTVENHT